MDPFLRGFHDPPQQDARVTAPRWIRENIPAGSGIVLDAYLHHYQPTVFTLDSQMMRANHGYSRDHFAHNPLLMKGLGYYYDRAAATERAYDLAFIYSRSPEGYDLGKIRINTGDYVVLSSRIYGRFSHATTAKTFPERTRKALTFYGIIRDQEPVKKFESNNAVIEIYRMREDLYPLPPVQ